MDTFKCVIPLHKCTVILPKIGKIHACLLGSKRKARERGGGECKDGGYLEITGKKRKKLKNKGI